MVGHLVKHESLSAFCRACPQAHNQAHGHSVRRQVALLIKQARQKLGETIHLINEDWTEHQQARPQCFFSHC